MFLPSLCVCHQPGFGHACGPQMWARAGLAKPTRASSVSRACSLCLGWSQGYAIATGANEQKQAYSYQHVLHWALSWDYTGLKPSVGRAGLLWTLQGFDHCPYWLPLPRSLSAFCFKATGGLRAVSITFYPLTLG